MEWSPEFVLLVELVFVELELIRRATLDLCEAGGLDDLRQVLGGLFAPMGIDQYAFIYVDGLVLGKGTPVIVSLELRHLLAGAVSGAPLSVHRSLHATSTSLRPSLPLVRGHCQAYWL